MAIGDIYQVTVVGRLHGQTTNNVTHYKETQSGAGDPATKLAQQCDAFMLPAFKAFCSAEWEALYVQAQKIRPVPIELAVAVNINAGAGTGGANSLPSSVAAVIKRLTVFAGRRFRGRSYIPGVPSGFEADSKLTASGLSNLNSLSSDFWQPRAVAGFIWLPGVYHRANGTTTTVIDAIGTPILRNQRRRQPGKGV
jgi:hypothetical protein